MGAISNNKLHQIVAESINKVLNRKQYECINSAKSWSEGAKNNFPKVKISEDKIMLSEGIQFEPNASEKGGVIIFSTDVNAVELSPNKIKNWIKQKLATYTNRVKATSKLDKIANKNQLVGWTIGHYFDGRYRAKSGANFGENSLSLEVVGIDFDGLVKIAEEICEAFQQESVLLHDFSSGRIMFIDQS